MGPEGFEPSTKRYTTQFVAGYILDIIIVVIRTQENLC